MGGCMRRVNKLKPRDGGIISGLPEERHGCAPKRGSPRAYPQTLYKIVGLGLQRAVIT